MAVKRLDNVAIVVADLDVAIAFFAEVGLTLEARAEIEGPWADRVVGLEAIRSEIAMMATPDGKSRLELTAYRTPGPVTTEPAQPPSNSLGMHRLMFNVDDVNDTFARLKPHGATLIGDIVDYEGIYRLCYLRGPSGIIVALAEDLA